MKMFDIMVSIANKVIILGRIVHLEQYPWLICKFVYVKSVQIYAEDRNVFRGKD